MSLWNRVLLLLLRDRVLTAEEKRLQEPRSSGKVHFRVGVGVGEEGVGDIPPTVRRSVTG